MATKSATPATRDAHPVTSSAVLEAFTELVYMVPEAPEDDGSSIIAAILEADDLDSINGQDKLPSSKDLVSTRIKVEKIARKVSDQESRTGFYLMCDGIATESRRPIRFTAGGDQAVAMMAKAYAMNWFPIVVEFSSVQTRSGNSAINCKILAKGGAGTVEA